MNVCWSEDYEDCSLVRCPLESFWVCTDMKDIQVKSSETVQRCLENPKGKRFGLNSILYMSVLEFIGTVFKVFLVVISLIFLEFDVKHVSGFLLMVSSE